MATGAGVDVAADLARLGAALAGQRIDCTTEERMQVRIAELFELAGIPCEREVRLSAHDRIDLLALGCGIECKIDGSSTQVTRQVIRYLEHPRIAGLLLVTGRARLGRILPASIAVGGAAKPVRVHETWKGNL